MRYGIFRSTCRTRSASFGLSRADSVRPPVRTVDEYKRQVEKEATAPDTNYDGLQTARLLNRVYTRVRQLLHAGRVGDAEKIVAGQHARTQPHAA